MRKFTTLLFCLFAIAGVEAQPSLKTIKKMPPVDKIGNISVLSTEGVGSAFVFKHGSDMKVLGVSETPYVKGMELPDGLRYWLAATNEAIANNQQSRAMESSVSPTYIPSFITTKWDQGSPYFNKCPQVNLKRVLTGCVATSLAQICKYFQYPAAGHGECTYSITKTTAGKTTTTDKTDVVNSSYDYANMLNDYKNKFSQTQADAVATLMRDCGYITGMNYGREASGANYFNAAAGITNNFDYNDRSLRLVFREMFTDEEWRDMIYAELIAKKPIMYAGDNPDTHGGHSFVFDGLQSDGKVHINWGWGGQHDGFYDIDIMCSSANYIDDQYMIFGFKPEKATETTPYEYEPMLYVANGKISSEDKNLMFTGAAFNYDFRNLEGDIALVVYNKTNPVESDTLVFMDQEPTEKEEDSYLKPLYGWGYGAEYKDNPLLLNDEFENREQYPMGDYEVYFIVRASFEEEYHKGRSAGGEWLATFSVAEDGRITVTNESTTTGIASIIADKHINKSQPYNLNGQLVNRESNGILIKNGKKILVGRP